jgi:hypothetical protein
MRRNGQKKNSGVETNFTFPRLAYWSRVNWSTKSRVNQCHTVPTTGLFGNPSLSGKVKVFRYKPEVALGVPGN